MAFWWKKQNIIVLTETMFLYWNKVQIQQLMLLNKYIINEFLYIYFNQWEGILNES